MEAWERQEVRESPGVSEQGFTFAHVTGFVVVAELQGLVDAGGGTAGDSSSEQTWNKRSFTNISSGHTPGLAAGCPYVLHSRPSNIHTLENMWLTNTSLIRLLADYDDTMHTCKDTKSGPCSGLSNWVCSVERQQSCEFKGFVAQSEKRKRPSWKCLCAKQICCIRTFQTGSKINAASASSQTIHPPRRQKGLTIQPGLSF